MLLSGLQGSNQSANIRVRPAVMVQVELLLQVAPKLPVVHRRPVVARQRAVHRQVAALAAVSRQLVRTQRRKRRICFAICTAFTKITSFRASRKLTGPLTPPT